MAVTVEIIEGPLKGSIFELKPGMKIGRSGSDLNLKDPKVSSHHAEVRQVTGSLNSLVLFDLGSTNGIKLDGKKINCLDLTPGIRFQIGNTHLKVLDEKRKTADSGPEISDWRAHLIRTVSKLPNLPLPALDVRVFDPMLRLTFLEGPQTGDEILLGYGPRKIGYSSADIDLSDATAPNLSFELVPLADGSVEFRTNNSKLIHLNALSKESEKIKTGDQLKLGQTVIEINFES